MRITDGFGFRQELCKDAAGMEQPLQAGWPQLQGQWVSTIVSNGCGSNISPIVRAGFEVGCIDVKQIAIARDDLPIRAHPVATGQRWPRCPGEFQPAQGPGTALAGPRLVAYGAPALPLAALGLPVFIHLPTFYATAMGWVFATVGAILLFARLWDVITDPLIGFLSDRTGGRFGRRRPWIVAGMPLVLAATWALFVPPDGAGAWHLLFWSLALYLGWTMMILPLSAWGAELSPDYHERSRIAAYREGFSRSRHDAGTGAACRLRPCRCG